MAARYALETHYVFARHPTVLTFDTKKEAEAFAAREIATYTGVSRVVIRPLTEADEGEDDNLAGPRGIKALLHIMGALVFSGWFVVRLVEIL